MAQPTALDAAKLVLFPCMLCLMTAAFPSQYAKWIDPEVPSSYKHEASPCAKDRVYAPAKAGDALLFYSYFPNG